MSGKSNILKVWEQSTADERAADVAGILPNQIQATTWLAWRRIHELGNLTIANYKVSYNGG